MEGVYGAGLRTLEGLPNPIPNVTQQNNHIKEQSVVLLTFALDFLCSFAVNTLFLLLFCELRYKFFLQIAENICDLKKLIEQLKNTITQQDLTIRNLYERLNIAAQASLL